MSFFDDGRIFFPDSSVFARGEILYGGVVVERSCEENKHRFAKRTFFLVLPFEVFDFEAIVKGAEFLWKINNFVNS